MFRNNDEGFTGLEAAIVLIAFVIVAAVFSYVVLGAGFFTTQKSQEVIHTGIQQASSTLEIVGEVYGTGSRGGPMNAINFSVALAPGGTSVDINESVIVYSNATELWTLKETAKGSPAATGHWSILAVQNEKTDDQVLEKGEVFSIMCGIPGGIYASDAFNVEINPSTGTALSLHRTAPMSVQAVNIVY